MIKKYALIKIIDILADENNELTMSDISKKAKTSIGMTKLILDYLLKEKIIEKKPVNRKTSLFILSDNFLTKQIKSFKIILGIHNSKLIEELIKINGDNLLSVLMFGSCADGSYDKNSDIDLLIINRKKSECTNLKSSLKFDRELNILQYTLNEWKDKAKKDHIFYEKIIFNHILLYGEKPIIN